MHRLGALRCVCWSGKPSHRCMFRWKVPMLRKRRTSQRDPTTWIPMKTPSECQTGAICNTGPTRPLHSSGRHQVSMPRGWAGDLWVRVASASQVYGRNSTRMDRWLMYVDLQIILRDPSRLTKSTDGGHKANCSKTEGCRPGPALGFGNSARSCDNGRAQRDKLRHHSQVQSIQEVSTSANPPNLSGILSLWGSPEAVQTVQTI